MCWGRGGIRFSPCGHGEKKYSHHSMPEHIEKRSFLPEDTLNNSAHLPLYKRVHRHTDRSFSSISPPKAIEKRVPILAEGAGLFKNNVFSFSIKLVYGCVLLLSTSKYETLINNNKSFFKRRRVKSEHYIDAYSRIIK